MSNQDPNIHKLLTEVITSAGEAASQRINTPVTQGTGSALDSSSILRFDIAFPGHGTLSWFVSNEDATGFADLLIGGGGDRQSPLTDMHLEALSNAFSEMLEQGVDTLNNGLTAPMEGGGVDMKMETAVPELPEGGYGQIDTIVIDGFGSLTIVQQVSSELVTVLKERIVATAAPKPIAQVPVHGEENTPEPQSPVDEDVSRVQAAIDSQFVEAASSVQQAVDNVVSLPASQAGKAQVSPNDLSLLMNVPLDVTVELGHTQQTVSQILDLNIGSILELGKLAGDPMDIFVNGRILARGEVVVIDEEFGIRITEIVDAEDRLRNVS